MACFRDSIRRSSLSLSIPLVLQKARLGILGGARVQMLLQAGEGGRKWTQEPEHPHLQGAT